MAGDAGAASSGNNDGAGADTGAALGASSKWRQPAGCKAPVRDARAVVKARHARLEIAYLERLGIRLTEYRDKDDRDEVRKRTRTER